MHNDVAVGAAQDCGADDLHPVWISRENLEALFVLAELVEREREAKLHLDQVDLQVKIGAQLRELHKRGLLRERSECG